MAYAGKGLFERAIADYDKAAALDPKLTASYTNRANANFYLGDFKAAARDYERGLRTDPSDIVSAIWLYLARERSGKDGAKELAGFASNLGLERWPGPIVSLFLGKAAPEQILKHIEEGDRRVKRERECEAFFYIGQYQLLRGKREEALRLFRKALETEQNNFIEFTGSKVELNRLVTNRQ